MPTTEQKLEAARTADGIGYSEGDLKAFAAGRTMLAVLEEVSDELDNRSDVVDGPDGQPRANWAMSLKRDVDEAIAAARAAGLTA